MEEPVVAEVRLHVEDDPCEHSPVTRREYALALIFGSAVAATLVLAGGWQYNACRAVMDRLL